MFGSSTRKLGKKARQVFRKEHAKMLEEMHNLPDDLEPHTGDIQLLVGEPEPDNGPDGQPRVRKLSTWMRKNGKTIK